MKASTGCATAALGNSAVTKNEIKLCHTWLRSAKPKCRSRNSAIVYVSTTEQYVLRVGHKPTLITGNGKLSRLAKFCSIPGSVFLIAKTPPTTVAPTTTTTATTTTTTAPPPPPPTTTTSPPPPTTVPPPTTSPPPAASCSPLTNGGNCYEPGEYCRASDHGASGTAGDGEPITCEDNNGWRWEPT